jgi:hypothetical protein
MNISHILILMKSLYINDFLYKTFIRYLVILLRKYGISCKCFLGKEGYILFEEVKIRLSVKYIDYERNII